MAQKIINNLNSLLNSLERKTGIYFASLIIALILLCIAALYVTPALAPKQLGRGYAALSINPFDFSDANYLHYRILTPFLAYCVGLRGNLYIIFPILISLFFLSTIYFYLRKKHEIAESFLITALISFSSPILFLLHFQGYVDVTSYLLIFLIFIFIKKPLLCILFLALALLNHASNIFSIPFLAFYYYINSNSKPIKIIYIIIGIFIAFLPFYVYRNQISAYVGIEYDVSSYSTQIRENIKTIASNFYAGIFNTFKLFWVFPLFAFYFYWKEKNKKQILFYILVILCTFSQLILASDTSRFIGLAFPLIILGAIKLKKKWGEQLFLKFTFYVLILNFFIPQYYVGQSTMIRFYTLPASLILKHVFGIETWEG